MPTCRTNLRIVRIGLSPQLLALPHKLDPRQWRHATHTHTHSLTHSLTHTHTHSHSLTHSLTHTHTHLQTRASVDFERRSLRNREGSLGVLGQFSGEFNVLGASFGTGHGSLPVRVKGLGSLCLACGSPLELAAFQNPFKTERAKTNEKLLQSPRAVESRTPQVLAAVPKTEYGAGGHVQSAAPKHSANPPRTCGCGVCAGGWDSPKP